MVHSFCVFGTHFLLVLYYIVQCTCDSLLPAACKCTGTMTRVRTTGWNLWEEQKSFYIILNSWLYSSRALFWSTYVRKLSIECIQCKAYNRWRIRCLNLFSCSIECKYHKWQLLYRVTCAEGMHTCKCYSRASLSHSWGRPSTRVLFGYCLILLTLTDFNVNNSCYVTTAGNNKQFCLNVKYCITYETLACRGDFDVADLGGKFTSFFDMMRSASQRLLKSVHPGFFGLKMLYGKPLNCCAIHSAYATLNTFYEVYGRGGRCTGI